MANSFNNKQFNDRKFIGELILKVLTDRIIVREALKLFPSDVDDSSIKSAYHALVHREADEDLRRRDLMYKDQQDSYLEQIANLLIQGKDLPKNVIKNYNQYYREIKINQTGFVKKLVSKLCKFMNV